VNVLTAVLSFAKAILGLVPLVGAYVFGGRSAKLAAAERALDEADEVRGIRRRVRRTNGAFKRLRERWSRK
jgi:hypothetical protein